MRAVVVSNCAALRLALSPAPAPRNDQTCFVREDNFAGFRVAYFILAERCIAFGTIGEMDGHSTMHSASIEDRYGQGIANADKVANINERIDARNIAFFGQAAQQGFGCAAILRRVNAKAAKRTAPRCQRRNLAQRRIANTL